MALLRVALIVTCVLSLNGVTSYEVYTMEPCHSGYTVMLGSNDKSALNFSLGNYKFDQLSSEPFKCSFHIEADRNEKIVAVIQRMNLRGNDFTCLDFVEFSDVPKLSLQKLFDRLNNQKKQICGNKNVSIMTLPNDIVLHAYDKYTLPQNVYISNRNEMKVKVGISRMPLRRDETLDFQIIFTAAKIGSECKDRSEYDCGNYTCIWKGFFKDGFINCPYAGCPDEDGCEAGPIVKSSSGSGTTIIIYAVVLIFSALGMALLCFFICRRCKVLCWAHRSPSVRDPTTRVHVSSSHPSEAAQPSAPPLISLHDKDLPPSYDSLFPARATDEGVSLVKAGRFRRNDLKDALEVCTLSTNILDDGIEKRRRTRNIPNGDLECKRRRCRSVSGDRRGRYRRPRNVSRNAENPRKNSNYSTERCRHSRNTSNENGQRCTRERYRSVSYDRIERYRRTVREM